MGQLFCSLTQAHHIARRTTHARTARNSKHCVPTGLMWAHHGSHKTLISMNQQRQRQKRHRLIVNPLRIRYIR